MEVDDNDLEFNISEDKDDSDNNDSDQNSNVGGVVDFRPFFQRLTSYKRPAESSESATLGSQLAHTQLQRSPRYINENSVTLLSTENSKLTNDSSVIYNGSLLPDDFSEEDDMEYPSDFEESDGYSDIAEYPSDFEVNIRHRGLVSDPEDVIKLVKSRFAERDRQIQQISRWLWNNLDRSPPPLFIEGCKATGKTAVVKAIFQEFGATYVFVNCGLVISLKQVLTLLFTVTQQHPSDDKPANNDNDPDDTGLETTTRVHQVRFPGQFISDLAVPNSLSNSESEESSGPQHSTLSMSDPSSRTERTIFFIFDEADKLRFLDPANTFLGALLELHKHTGRKTGVVLISRQPWSTFLDSTVKTTPQMVWFDSYTKQELTSIIVRQLKEYLAPEDCRFINEFVQYLVASFFFYTNSVIELFELCIQIYPEFLEPPRNSSFAELEKIARKKKLFDVSRLSLAENPWQGSESSALLADQLSFQRAYLLLAAYLATNIDAASDRKYFDVDSKSTAKPRRKDTGLLADQSKIRLRTFTFERLLAIYEFSRLIGFQMITPMKFSKRGHVESYRCVLSRVDILPVAKKVRFDITQYLPDDNMR